MYNGLAAGALFAVFSLCVFAYGANPFGRTDLMFMPIYAVVMVFGMLRVRNRHNDGVLHGAHGISFGFVSGMTGNLLYGLFAWFFLSTLSPGTLELHISELQAWLENGKEDFVKQFGADVFAQMQEANKSVSAGKVAADKLIKMFIPMVVVSVMAAMFCKKDKTA